MVNPDNKVIAKTVAKVFSGKPKVFQYWDNDNRSNVHILEASDSPIKGVNAYSTVNLSDHEIWYGKKVFEGGRVELLGACNAEFQCFGNIISTAAFNIINSKHFCCPGVVFPGIVRMYKESRTLEHLYFAPPFLWGNQPETLKFESKTVLWLMVVPISDAERKFVEKEGPLLFEKALEKKKADVCDLNRKSIV